ncbi:MAG: hybrid sensor histidine kinase/response regulator [Chloroflexi bacterium]|nr:hybrid sensor histidine kinase/response regulator [Chloroflexota bacterium]
MAVTDDALWNSTLDLTADLEDLRRGLLPLFMAPFCLVPFAWAAYANRASSGLTYVDLAVALLIPVVLLVLWLRTRHFYWACAALLGGLIASQSLLLAVYPDELIAAYGLLIPLIGYALVSAKAALAVLFATWAANIGSWIFLSPAPLSPSRAVALLLLYLLVLAVTWLAARPLRASIGWALAGWEQARQLLGETRERRFELYRALRALEEATYRIERMNHELILARREAEEARAQKARFVAIVSHELRGPLNLILGYSRLMAMSPESYPEPLPLCYRADVVTVYRNSRLLASLVDDILDLSQIEADKLPLVKERTDLKAHVIDEVVGAIEPLARRKGLYIECRLPQELPMLIADRVRLRQVLLNLLMNAVRLTERGGITLEVIPQESSVEVLVRDTGPGMSAEEMRRIFQEFHHGDKEGDGGDREARGTGLGLPICKQLIELHGGRISVESELGVGTTFRFTLPALGAELPTAKRIGQVGTKPGIKRDRVLVHASGHIVRLISRYLERYEVLGVADERELLNMVEELHPRAILTSSECAATLQGLLPDPYDVPILSCPWLGGDGRLNDILSYLVKPVSVEALHAVIGQVEHERGETTVLLVDDDPEAVRLLETLLMTIPRPYRVLKAFNGAQALATMQTVAPDVVLLDLVMPGMDGLQTLAAMREQEHLRHVPVVIVSARDWADGQIALETPITLRRKKPLDMSTSIRLLGAILEVMTADYLGGSADLPPLSAAPRGQSAFPTPGRRRAPAPGSVG